MSLGVLALGLALAGPPAHAGSCSGKVVAPAAAGTCAVNGAPCTHPGDPTCNPTGVCNLGVGGRATFYDFGGMGACLLPFANPGTALIAAINEPEFADSAFCGRCLRVSGPLGSVVVQVVDLCPFAGNETWCGDRGHLDLNRPAFAAIANPSWGVVAVDWETVACPGVGALAIAYDPAANPWWVASQVRQNRYGVAAVDVKRGQSWVSVPRDGNNRYVYEPGGSGDNGPFTFRITDVNGQVVQAAGVPFAAGSVQPTSVQLPLCDVLFADGFEAGGLGAWSHT
jgi:expansin (peptidoglycan-binding protein)